MTSGNRKIVCSADIELYEFDEAQDDWKDFGLEGTFRLVFLSAEKELRFELVDRESESEDILKIWYLPKEALRRLNYQRHESYFHSFVLSQKEFGLNFSDDDQADAFFAVMKKITS